MQIVIWMALRTSASLSAQQIKSRGMTIKSNNLGGGTTNGKVMCIVIVARFTITAVRIFTVTPQQ